MCLRVLKTNININQESLFSFSEITISYKGLYIIIYTRKILKLCQLRNAIKAVHELEKCSLVHPARLNLPAQPPHGCHNASKVARFSYMCVRHMTLVGGGRGSYILIIFHILFFWTITRLRVVDKQNATNTNTYILFRTKILLFYTTTNAHKKKIIIIYKVWKRFAYLQQYLCGKIYFVDGETSSCVCVYLPTMYCTNFNIENEIRTRFRGYIKKNITKHNNITIYSNILLMYFSLI